MTTESSISKTCYYFMFFVVKRYFFVSIELGLIETIEVDIILS